MDRETLDIIEPDEGHTLHGLFRERLRRTPEADAYRHYDETTQRWIDYSWQVMAHHIERWRAALKAEGLAKGERVAIMARNSPRWVMFEQAALSLGLVVVPLYVEDHAGNVAYVLNDAGVKLLLIDNLDQWARLQDYSDQLGQLNRVVCMGETEPGDETRIRLLKSWLPDEGLALTDDGLDPMQLATIVYTSGTTGAPKGVMLSHHNILWNARGGLNYVPAFREDVFLSFLPLSHTFERTAGYYLPMMAGSLIAYSRSIPQLAEDLTIIRPSVLISVPRIFERVRNRIREQLETKPPLARLLFEGAVSVGWLRFEYRQHRASWNPRLLLWPLMRALVAGKIQQKLGGRLRIAISGGAPLAHEVAQLFIGLGVDLLQGYGLTETSPVISVNKSTDNEPASVGIPLAGIEYKLDKQGELLVKSPGVMLGYWNHPQATREMFDEQGWLRTGDKARLENGHLYITGRLKEIIVLANGEKVPPADMEMAIANDPLFEQVMVVGEGKPYLGALLVVDQERWHKLLESLECKSDETTLYKQEAVQQQLLERVMATLEAFPGYAVIRRVALADEAWTVDNRLITPTLKLKRKRIEEACAGQIEWLYRGH